MLLCAIIATIISIFPIGAFIAGWANCSFKHYDICYTLELYGPGDDANALPDIVLRDTNGYEPGILCKCCIAGKASLCTTQMHNYVSTCIYVSHKQ